jgi:hypothetical protein
MGLFSSLFGGGIEDLLNPISRMKRREFVIADDDPGYLKHYFRFTRLSAHTQPTRGHLASRVSAGELCDRAVSSRPTQIDSESGPEIAEPGLADSTTQSKFRVTHVGETFSGAPQLHIEPAPISVDGWPELSEDLESLIAPYLSGRDNVAIRYTDDGLPTTSTAVMDFILVANGSDAIQYAVRIMLFETGTKKVGSNVHVRPEFNCRMDPTRAVMQKQKIAHSRTYKFREVYDTTEQSRDDLSRLVKIAHAHFTNNNNG